MQEDTIRYTFLTRLVFVIPDKAERCDVYSREIHGELFCKYFFLMHHVQMSSLKKTIKNQLKLLSVTLRFAVDRINSKRKCQLYIFKLLVQKKRNQFGEKFETNQMRNRLSTLKLIRKPRSPRLAGSICTIHESLQIVESVLQGITPLETTRPSVDIASGDIFVFKETFGILAMISANLLP